MVRRIARWTLVLVLLTAAAWAAAGPRADAGPPPGGWEQLKGKTFSVTTTDNRKFKGVLTDVRLLNPDNYLVMRIAKGPAEPAASDYLVNTRYIVMVENLP